MSESRDVECPHCHANADTMDVRVIVGNADGSVTQTRHTEGCVDYGGLPARPGEEPTA